VAIAQKQTREEKCLLGYNTAEDNSQKRDTNRDFIASLMEVSYTNPTTIETSAKNSTSEENYNSSQLYKENSVEKITSRKEGKQKEELKGACNSETKRKRKDLNSEDRKLKWNRVLKEKSSNNRLNLAEYENRPEKNVYDKENQAVKDQNRIK
ncbi:7619_t:CDS:2, partial [Dentiscutata erythropus]